MFEYDEETVKTKPIPIKKTVLLSEGEDEEMNQLQFVPAKYEQPIQELCEASLHEISVHP